MLRLIVSDRKFQINYTAIRSFSVLLLLLLLSACDDDGCIPTNSFSDIYTATSVAQGNARQTIEPDGRGLYVSPENYGVWINAGIEADGKSELDIGVQGTITTCPPVTQTIEGVVKAYYGVNQSNRWTNTNIYVDPRDELKIEVAESRLTGSCTYGTSKPCDDFATCVSVWDNNSSNNCKKDGVGLLGTISSSDPSADLGAGVNVPELSANGNFSAWGSNNVPDVPHGGYSGALTSLEQAGNLYLKINDCTAYNGCMYDNKGGYAVTVTATSGEPPASCTYKNGDSLDILIKNGGAPTSRTDGSAIIVNSGGYSGIPSASGDIWLRVHDNTDSITDYSDNSGSYYVTIQQTVLDNTTFSSAVYAIVDPIEESLDEVKVALYNTVIADSYMKRIVNACLLLYVIFYALFFMLGLIKDKQTDMVIKGVKIGVMLALMSEDSWEFFDQYLFSIFSEGSKFLINAATGSNGDEDSLFTFLDYTIGQFFTANTWRKIGSLIIAFPIGTMYFVMIVMGFFIYLLAAIEAVVAYLIALVAITVMIILAPFFFIFLLFSVTRPLFDAWVSFIFNFALQPVVLFTGLVIFNEIMEVAFQQALGFEVCWTCIWSPVIPVTSWGIPSDLLLGETIPDVPLGCWANLHYPQGGGDFWNPINFFAAVMMFLIISDGTRKFVAFSPDLVAMLTGAGQGGDRVPFSTGSVIETLEGVAGGVKNVLAASVGADDKSQERRKLSAEISTAKEKLRKAAENAAENLEDGAPKIGGTDSQEETADSNKKTEVVQGGEEKKKGEGKKKGEEEEGDAPVLSGLNQVGKGAESNKKKEQNSKNAQENVSSDEQVSGAPVVGRKNLENLPKEQGKPVSDEDKNNPPVTGEGNSQNISSDGQASGVPVVGRKNLENLPKEQGKPGSDKGKNESFVTGEGNSQNVSSDGQASGVPVVGRKNLETSPEKQGKPGSDKGKSKSSVTGEGNSQNVSSDGQVNEVPVVDRKNLENLPKEQETVDSDEDKKESPVEVSSNKDEEVGSNEQVGEVPVEEGESLEISPEEQETVDLNEDKKELPVEEENIQKAQEESTDPEEKTNKEEKDPKE